MFNGTWRDLAHAARSLAKGPGFHARLCRLSNAEPLAYVVGAAIAVLVAILARLAHARRAASVQPMAAMRSI